MLLIAVPLIGQVTENFDVGDLYDGTYWADYITETSTRYTIYDPSLGITSGSRDEYVLRYVTSLDSSADTLYTDRIDNRAYGDHWISYAVVSDSASDGGARVNPDTIISYLDMGVFRGHGTVAGTATGTVDGNGVLWKNLATVSVGVSAEISLKDSTWWTDFPVSWYMYRWRETSPQSNKYYMTDSKFKQN
jgi:hypothetical protein